MKVVVAIPIQQHSFELAKALQETGDLDTYITSIYYKKFNLTGVVSHFLPADLRLRAKSRHIDGLPDKKVKQFCEIDNLAVTFIAKKLPEYYSEATRRFRDKFDLRIRNFIKNRDPDMVITYDGCSPLLFEWMKKEMPQTIRVLDVSAANPIYMKAIYEKDFHLAPDFSEMLRLERDFCWDSQLLERQDREFMAAQYFLVGSEFVRKSLMYSGIDSGNIYTCRYGVDLNAFREKEHCQPSPGEKVRFLYVGGTKELKGISYLLKAYQKLDHEKAELTIVGANTLSEDLQSKYCSDVDFTGYVSFSEMPEVFRTHDVFVFPSLGEGFGLVILEAMASGLPVISTVNTGAFEVIEEGKDGFLVPVQDENILAERMQWFVDYREQIPQMGEYAAASLRNWGGQSMDWTVYHQTVQRAIQDITGKTGGEV